MELNLKITTIKDAPEYFADLLKLIEEEFTYDKDNHFKIDFAPLVSPDNFHNLFIVIDTFTNTLISHIGSLERSLSYQNITKLDVLFIGGIVTHKSYRNKGIFKFLFNHVLSIHAKKALFILWSDLHGVYEKFGFYLSGATLETGNNVINDIKLLKVYQKTKFSDLSESDFNQIIALYNNQNSISLSAIRNEKDWNIIKQMDSVNLYVKRMADNTITHYFCESKGKDLKNIIHEVSFLNDLNEIKKISQYKLWLPEYFFDHFKSSPVQYTGFVKIGCQKSLNSFFKNSGTDLEILLLTSNTVTFSIESKKFETSIQDFLHSVFGPSPVEEIKKYKFSLYISGLDSI